MPQVVDPTVLHFLGSVTIAIPAEAGSGRVTRFGDEMTVTDEIRLLNTDSAGDCCFDLLDDEAAQAARWGTVMFRRGVWPTGQSRNQPGQELWWDGPVTRGDEGSQASADRREQRLSEMDRQAISRALSSRTLATYGAHVDE